MEVLEEHHIGTKEEVKGGGYCLPWGVLPSFFLNRYVGSQRVWFSTVLVINSVSILSILVINRVWFLPSSLDVGMFLRRTYLFCLLFIIIKNTINKSSSQIWLNIFGLN